MINVNIAIKDFKNEYPNRKIENACIYKDSLLIVAPENIGGTDYNDPYFLVDERGNIKRVSIAMDPAGFTKAMRERRIEISK